MYTCHCNREREGGMEGGVGEGGGEGEEGERERESYFRASIDDSYWA